MSEPERLLATGSTLARRILESAAVERPSNVSLERTMASLAKESGLRSRTRGRGSDPRERWVVRSSVQLRSRGRQWPWLALLATASLILSAVLSYNWRPASPVRARTSESAPTSAGFQLGVR